MSQKNSYFFTSESVSEGHPDKVCDQVSDAVLDAMLRDDPLSRVACECYATTGMIVIGGEITTQTYVDLQKLVRGVIADIGYTKPDYRFDSNSCAVINVINHQSPDISMGVNVGGAGDQGMMFGYACDETPELMPAPLMFSHQLVRRLADLRKNSPDVIPYLRPDSKSQVTIEYDNETNKILRVDTIVISTQHDENIKQGQIFEDIKREVITPIIPENLFDDKTKIFVNPTGNFVIGGPHGDTAEPSAAKILRKSTARLHTRCGILRKTSSRREFPPNARSRFHTQSALPNRLLLISGLRRMTAKKSKTSPSLSKRT